MFITITLKEDKREMMTQLNISTEGFLGKYLGLPVYTKKSKTKAFEYIKEKLWRKIKGGKEKMLSKDGREILIKVGAQAIPVYAMSYFDLTKSIFDDISSMIRRYQSIHMDKENKVHCIGWEKLRKPKEEEGLGFKYLYSLNLAMLARKTWRTLQNLYSLCTQVLLAKYFPNKNVLSFEPKNGISYCWRSILKGIDQVLTL